MIVRLRAWLGSAEFRGAHGRPMLGGLARSRAGAVALVASSILLGLLTAQFGLGLWAF